MCIRDRDVDVMIDALTFLFEFILKNMFLPGQIENWVFIMDLENMGLFNLPITPLKRLMGYVSNNYRSRLYIMYILNTPSSIFIPWNVVKGVLEENTVKKINFFKTPNAPSMFDHIHPDQIEQRQGGKAKNRDGDCWPPKLASHQNFLPKDDLSTLLLTDEVYYERYQKGELKSNRICKEIIERVEAKHRVRTEASEVDDALQMIRTGPADRRFSNAADELDPDIDEGCELPS
eukprot:TRINITY_DN704_c0_g1_i5.p2 TRINITY_DN704_c0_g1~~TRINITY_DN704_c0_g1_i5.p2  ORF type:complete len:233 (+),score=63.98 TRINITY_DN704_c0_g1_i5:66-764(+)